MNVSNDNVQEQIVCMGIELIKRLIIQSSEEDKDTIARLRVSNRYPYIDMDEDGVLVRDAIQYPNAGDTLKKILSQKIPDMAESINILTPVEIRVIDKEQLSLSVRAAAFSQDENYHITSYHTYSKTIPSIEEFYVLYKSMLEEDTQEKMLLWVMN